MRIWQKMQPHPGLLIAIATFAALVLVKFGWGIPVAISPETLSTWPVDTIAPVRPLTEAFHMFDRSGTDPVVYPLFHFVLLDIFYSPYVALQYLLGGFNVPSSEFPYGIADPAVFFRHLTVIARMVSFLMGIGIVLGIYRITELVASRQAATWTVAFLVLLAPLVYYARTSNLDVPYLFWSTMAILQFIRASQNQKLGAHVAFAAFLALAVATKDQAYGFFLLLPVVLLVKTAIRYSKVAKRPFDHLAVFADKTLLITAATVIVVFALANNLLFGGLEGFLRHIDFAATFYDDTLTREFPDLYTIGHQWSLIQQSASIVLGMLGIGTCLLILGGVALAVRDRAWPALTLLLVVFSYYVAVIMYAGVVLPRYLLGPVIFLLPFAGISANWLFQRYQHYRRLLPAAAAIVVAWPFLLCVNMNLTLIGDSRYAMEAWVRNNVEPGSKIETQIQTRYLPHLSDQYDIDLVGNSLNVFTYDVISSELSAQALEQRNPEYILILKGLGVTGDPARMSGPAADYFDALINEELGYELLAQFETPSFLRYKQVTAGTRPTSYFLARKL